MGQHLKENIVDNAPALIEEKEEPKPEKLERSNTIPAKSESDVAYEKAPGQDINAEPQEEQKGPTILEASEIYKSAVSPEPQDERYSMMTARD